MSKLYIQATRARCEAATGVLDDAAFDAHLANCRDHRRDSFPFGECLYEPCIRRRFALIVLNADLPAALEALEEAQGKLDAVDEWQEDWDGVGTIDWTALSRILKGE